jgi:hypothetical protein
VRKPKRLVDVVPLRITGAAVHGPTARALLEVGKLRGQDLEVVNEKR